MSTHRMDGDYDWLNGPSSLGSLFDLAARRDGMRGHFDLAELLRAQLDMPLPKEKPDKSTGRGERALRTLLSNAATPLDTLVAIKDQSKAWLNDDLVFREVASVIYLSAIAAAIVHHGRTTTRLTNEAMSRQFVWALAQQWIDPQLRELLRKGADAMAEGGKSNLKSR